MRKIHPDFAFYAFLVFSVPLLFAIGCAESSKFTFEEEKVFDGTLQWVKQDIGTCSTHVEFRFQENETTINVVADEPLTATYSQGDRVVLTYGNNNRLIRIEAREDWVKRRHGEIVMPTGEATLILEQNNLEKSVEK